MTQRRAVDLDEDQPKTISDVLHQRCLAVARRRHEEQQAHLVGALALADGAHLLRQVVADER